MNSGPLDIQPLAKARQIQEDDSSQQRQLEYHPEASGPGSAVAASANAVHHAFARVAQPVTQAGSAVYTPAVPQPGSAVTLQLCLSHLLPIRFTTGLVILLRHTREWLDVLGLLQCIYD